MNEKLYILGPQSVKGTIEVSGAKNSVLPIMCASLLSEQIVELSNVPNLNDVSILRGLINEIGRPSEKFEENIYFSEKTSNYNIVVSEDANKIRYSVLLLGALLATNKEVILPLPGGCSFSARPIDIHLEGLKQLGAEIIEEGNYIKATAKELVGADITLRFPSVGATENLIIASAKASGKTILRNIAIEPEIIDLIDFLNSLGAKIKFIGSQTLEIMGVKKLGEKKVNHRIISDRIEAGTYLFLGALAAENYIDIENFEIQYNISLLKVAQKIGIKFKILSSNKIRVYKSNVLKAVEVETGVYPELATDLQPLLAVLLTQASGISKIIDPIYPSRFQYANELNSMGTDIDFIDSGIKIRGGSKLSATKDVYSYDLRGGAALILAALIAEGESEITNVYQVYRGYSNLDMKLKGLGVSLDRDISGEGRSYHELSTK